MKIKRYMAASMRAALDQVRLEQGPDAVILSSRRIDEGVEVIAAVDYDEALIAGAARQYAMAASAAANAEGAAAAAGAKKPSAAAPTAPAATGAGAAAKPAAPSPGPSGRLSCRRHRRCGARWSGAHRLRWLAIWPRSPFRRTRSADSPPCNGS